MKARDAGVAFSSLVYLPQSPCSLLLVDVDEITHHAALDHISLSLHPDLKEQKNVQKRVNLKQGRC